MALRLQQHLVGEKLRQARLQLGMTLRTLARQTGFSPSFMSQVENGQVSPSIGSMERIASAVGLTLGEFFDSVAGGEGGLIVRVADRQSLSSRWSDAEIEVLSAPRSRLEMLLITLRPGGRSGKHPYAHPSEEVAFVAHGEVMLTLGAQEHRLRLGDAATILAGELRLWRNCTRAPARIVIVSSTARPPIARGGRRRAAATRPGAPPQTSRRRRVARPADGQAGTFTRSPERVGREPRQRPAVCAIVTDLGDQDGLRGRRGQAPRRPGLGHLGREADSPAPANRRGN